MIKNYFKIALRGFWKHKLFTLINIIGLSIGISASLVIFLIVQRDFTFDKFENDGSRIYRVVTHYDFLGQKGQTGSVTAPLVEAMKSQTTGIGVIAPLHTLKPDVSIDNSNRVPEHFKAQDRVVFADQQYFNIINYVWLAGSPRHALDAPNHVVLTAKQAKLYFPALSYNQMIGKVVTYDTLKATVTGVVQNLIQNTDFTFHDFISLSTASISKRLTEDLGLKEWGNTSSGSHVLIKLMPGASVANIIKQLNAIYRKNNTPRPGQQGSSIGYNLQPLDDIHFNGDYGSFDFSGTANKTTLYCLLAIAAFLLLLGCINFVNLTTAQATQRAKEIGIRKAIGSSRRQLVFQFLSETFFITMLAVVISVVLTPAVLKQFADFISPDVKLDLLHQPGIILFLVIITITVSVLSGFYPAIILSGYKPMLVLKNQAQNNSNKSRNARLRKTLTVLQFVIAQFFIMATVLVSKQIYYALHKDLGFKKDAILVINTSWKTRKEKSNQILLNKFRLMPQLALVSLGQSAPSSNGGSFTAGTYIDGKKEIKTELELKIADENYLKVYQIKLLAGRNIQRSDMGKVIIINNTYAKILGFQNPTEAIGKQLDNPNPGNKLTIIGVVADFYERSLHSPINPLIIYSGGGQFQLSTFHVALKPETVGGNEWKTAIVNMGKAWKEVYPDDDFEYSFFDESIAKFYEEEQHTSKLLAWATGLSIFISCLGLLGLAIYTTNQRTKEIGVRKVLGASVSQIVTLLSTELVLLIMLAFVIVTPVAWWAMHKWMEGFAERTSISWWIFAASGVMMLLAAVFTSSFQTVKAAVANPVKSLRSE
ncbi:FtsX-like permease family protein [Mucilaginibacter sp.]|uniref:FtsX-like permease family protein n=1 Tax=Mucilaginibacter sp. TaxID=1882438 RepID=UPI002848E0D1|nr:FtsX-like permease family protein [Mucilaginibacter sp.]MDR3693667.1 ABC transporter permease [Mucilaginibacter sp.]